MIWRHWPWTARLLLIGCLLAGTGIRAAEIVDLAAVTTRLALVSRVAVLEDRQAVLAPAQALRQQDWLPSTPEALNRGVTSVALWLRLEVVNRSDKTITRWLTLGSPRLERVDYYRFATGETMPAEVAVSGLARALERRPEAGLVSIFPVRLAPGEGATLLLRVEGRTRMWLVPDLWEPLAYRVHEADLSVSQLVPLCALLGVAFYMLVHGVAHRTRDMLLLAVWLASMALYELSFSGQLYRFVLHAGGEWPVRATVFLSNLCMAVGAGFTLLFLRLHQQRGWFFLYLLSMAVSGLLAAQSAFGDLQAANRSTVPLLAGFFVLWPVSVAAAWYRRISNAGLFLLAILGVWITVLLRLAEELGWRSMNFLSSSSPTIRPSLVLALMMVFGVVRRSFLEQRAYRAAQAMLLRSRQDEHVRLEALVRERTRFLQDAVIAADDAHRARSELLARVNHDLRRPASEIVALAEPLEQEGGECAEYGPIIHRNASQLQGLIDDLIDEADAGSPLGAIRPEPVDLPRLLDGLALANGNTFTWSPRPGMPSRVLLDPKRLRQIMINLLDNAAKFTRAGRIRLRADVVSGTEGPRLALTVSDTGIGMNAEQLSEMFVPYQRAKEVRGLPGLGLGLAIARHWVECMGGRISADSAPGQGTTMTVSLPLMPTDTGRVARPVSDRRIEPALPPDAASLELARYWLRLGAVSDLLDWAADLAVSQPGHRAFAQGVTELAARGDLSSLACYLQPDTDRGGTNDVASAPGPQVG